MKEQDLEIRIAELLHARRSAPMTAGEIASELGLRGAQRKRLQKILSGMTRNGDAVSVRGNRYAFGEAVDLVPGVLAVARSGNGIVTPDGRESSPVFVAADDLGTALPGDRVLVRLAAPPAADGSHGEPGVAPDRRLRRAGRVMRVLERARHDIVGTLRSTGRFFSVVPIDPAYAHDFYVPGPAGGQVGDRVVVRFEGWQNRHVSPEGAVIEVLGPADRPTVDTRSVLRHYGIEPDFPAAVLREAESASIYGGQPGPRADLRDAFVLTIDPRRARDFDDALSIRLDPSTATRRLGVHIADVSHFVKSDGALDREAAKRGNSVYFPDQVVPMLPEQLSNGICSLKPGEDRLAVSVFLTIDAAGNVLRREFARSVIRSRHRLTYEEAMAALSTDSGGVRDAADFDAETLWALRELHSLAQQLRRRRFARFALELDTPECEIEMADDGTVRDIRLVPNDISHQLVEECMVAANEAVALELTNRGVPTIQRVHEKPSPERIEMLAAELAGMGFEPGNLNSRRNLAVFLKATEGHPLAPLARVAVLRSMKRAVYSATAQGHYGLAKAAYSHFTSPIRRYPDLVVHRQVKAILCPAPSSVADEAEARVQGERPRSHLPGQSELDAMAAVCSRTEQVADEAERTITEIKKLRFLESLIAQESTRSFAAVVTNVTNFGLFVNLPGIHVQGLVHVSAVSDRYVRYDRRRGVLRSGRTAYGVGDRIEVVPAKVDFDARRIDFALA